MLPLDLLLPAIFASTVLAQHLHPASQALVNISFGDGSYRSCDDDLTGPGTLALSILTAPQTPGPICFNFNETFSNSQANYSERGYTCSGNTACGVNYTVTRFTVPFVQNNFSQIHYSQTASPSGADSGSDEKGRVRFQAYNSLNCLQVAGEVSENGGQDIQPWYRWDCKSDGDCMDLPFSVRSFSIAGVDPDSVKCTLAQRYGGGAGRISEARGFAALAVAFLALAYLA